MGQDRDEPVHAYSARLKGQARVCQFTGRCQCSICPNHDACVGVDYNDIVVRDQVILGCADHEIKLDCLIEKGHSASLEEVMAFVESNESGQPSLQQLNGGSVAAAPASSFRKQQRGMFKQQTPPTPLLTPTCTHCAAYSQICTKCGKRGHFAALCRQQSTSGTRHGQRRSHMSPKRENATAAVFQSLFSASNAQLIDDNEIICNLRDFELEHCIYDPTHDTLVNQYSAPQPTLGLYATHYPCDTHALGLQTPLRRPQKLHWCR